MKKYLLFFFVILGAFAQQQIVDLPSNIPIKGIPTAVNNNISYLYANKLHFSGAWSNSTSYNFSDVVTYSGNTYVSIFAGNVGHQPNISTSYWTILGSNGGSFGAFKGVTIVTGDKSMTLGDCGGWFLFTTANAIATLSNTPVSNTCTYILQYGNVTGTLNVHPGTALIVDTVAPGGSTADRTVLPGEAKTVATDGTLYTIKL